VRGGTRSTEMLRLASLFRRRCLLGRLGGTVRLAEHPLLGVIFCLSVDSGRFLALLTGLRVLIHLGTAGPAALRGSRLSTRAGPLSRLKVSGRLLSEDIREKSGAQVLLAVVQDEPICPMSGALRGRGC